LVTSLSTTFFGIAAIFILYQGQSASGKSRLLDQPSRQRRCQTQKLSGWRAALADC